MFMFERNGNKGGWITKHPRAGKAALWFLFIIVASPVSLLFTSTETFIPVLLTIVAIAVVGLPIFFVLLWIAMS